jgi:WD40 repeat protein
LFDAIHKLPPSIISQLQSIHVGGMSFSPDGRLLAIMSKEAVLRVFDVTDPTQPIQRLAKPIAGGWDVNFLDSDVIVASKPTGLEFLHLNGEAESLSFPEGSYWDANWRTHQFAQATTLGELLILESFPSRIVRRRQLCQSPIMGVRFIPMQDKIAYICRDGILGIWDLQHNLTQSRVLMEGHAGLIDVSISGEYLLAAGGNGTLAVLDMHTDLVTFYKGHSFRLTSITPATSEYPFIISADARGSVRVWPLPTRVARIVTTSPTRFYTAIFYKDSSAVIASTGLSALTSYSSSKGIRSIGPHDFTNIYLERSRSGDTFVTHGFGETIEIWSMDGASITRTQALQTRQGSIAQLAFLEDSSDFITSGRDGRLVRWTSKGEATTLAHLNQPTDKFALLRSSDFIVFSTADGALWRLTDSDRQYRALRPPGAQVTRIVATVDRRLLYVGYANGDVIEIDPLSWQGKTVLHSSRAIRDIAISANGDIIAVATNDEALFVGSRASSNTEDITWSVLPARVSHLSLTSDGLLVAPCVNGLLWIYATYQHRWLCLSTGIVNLGWSTMADDDSAAVVLDSEGHLIWVALNDCRKLLNI